MLYNNDAYVKYIKELYHNAMALPHSGLRLNNLFSREKTCACGHPAKYHIQGFSKCLFGVCGCDHYYNSC
ncbi:hypothetical protein Ngar_c14790 [Candidatus Nitrososphaera gargensis Ga9.2]|uniref:Transposase n=1 Tax=Nitrososphaera gargensis (strain Ga9.2) TaxID=1237085 RepID=K0IF52_NITGG|nr:hypothetical protein Ngar_c14790 [Candidatus Nitrososphaera gargensis Ga9.2]